MEKLLNFIDYIAWVTAVCSFTLLVLRILGALHYSKLEKTLDKMRGVKVTFPIKVPLILFVVSSAWLIA